MALFVFAGQSCTEDFHGEDMKRLAGAVRSAATDMGVRIEAERVCFAPEHTDRKWAVL